MSTGLDPSKLPMKCENCGTLVLPEIIENITGVDVDQGPSGSVLRWKCEMCGHIRMSAISADVSGEQLEQLERQEEEFWRHRHQEDE